MSPQTEQGNPDPFYHLGCFYQIKGEDEKAVREFKKAILIDPGHVGAYNRLGVSYDRLKNFSEAIISYKTALGLDPDQYYIYNNMGFSYVLQGLYDDAIEAFRKGISLNKEDTHLHNNLGMVYALTGRYDEAFEEYKAGADEAWAYYRMGRFYYEKGMLHEAKGCFSEALKATPSSSTSQNLLNIPPDILAAIPYDIRGERGTHEESSSVDPPDEYFEEAVMARGNGKLGCIAPLTGPLSKYGEKMANAVTMAIDEYNKTYGTSVNLVLLDSMGSPDIAQKCVKAMAYQEKVSAIIGPLLASTTSSAASIAEKIGIPLFTPTAPKPEQPVKNGFIFSNSLNNRDQAEALANYAFNEMGLTSFGIFSPSNIYGREMTDFFADQIHALGGIIEIIEFYNQEATDFRQQLIKIHEAKPEALFIPDIYKNILLIVPQIFFYNPEEEDSKEPDGEDYEERIQLLGTNGWYNDKLLEEIKPYVNGAILSVGFYPESKEAKVHLFVSNFKERYGEPPDLISAQSYDVANILLEVSSGGSAPWNLIKERLLRLHNFPCVSGMTTMLPSGNARKGITLLKVEGEGFVPIEQL